MCEDGGERVTEREQVGQIGSHRPAACPDPKPRTKGSVMNYIAFKNGPASGIFAGLGEGWADVPKLNESFEGLRWSVVNRNDRDHGSFVKAARSYSSTCSSGELRLLLAVCTMLDFAHVADDLAGGRAWQDITIGCDLRYRAAIAACVLEAP